MTFLWGPIKHTLTDPHKSVNLMIHRQPSDTHPMASTIYRSQSNRFFFFFTFYSCGASNDAKRASRKLPPWSLKWAYWSPSNMGFFFLFVLFFILAVRVMTQNGPPGNLKGGGSPVSDKAMVQVRDDGRSFRIFFFFFWCKLIRFLTIMHSTVRRVICIRCLGPQKVKRGNRKESVVMLYVDVLSFLNGQGELRR